MITLPTSAPTDIFSATGTLFTDLWQLIAVVVGVPLAFYIIDIIIQIVWPGHSLSQISDPDRYKDKF